MTLSTAIVIQNPLNRVGPPDPWTLAMEQKEEHHTGTLTLSWGTLTSDKLHSLDTRPRHAWARAYSLARASRRAYERPRLVNMARVRDTALQASGQRRPRLLIQVLSVVLLLVPGQPAAAHPQCLDFKPPFKPPWHLEFCAQYEQFGCCDQRTDNQIAERYWDVIDHLEAAGYDLCEDILKELMCQVNRFLLISVAVEIPDTLYLYSIKTPLNIRLKLLLIIIKG